MGFGSPQYEGMISLRLIGAGALVVLVAAGAASLAFTRGAPDRGTEAARTAKKQPVPPADLYVSPSGSDTSRCTKAAPCASFDVAYHVAKPGDIVQVAGGTYPGQIVEPDARKTAGPAVVFRPATGARVTLTEELRVNATYVEFRSMAMPDWYASSTADHVTFRSIDADAFYITGGNNIRVLGGDYGPSAGLPSEIKACGDCTTQPKNILIDRAYFHDYTRPDEAHVECLHVMASDGITVRNSRFQRCAVMDMAFHQYGSGGATTNVLIENNFLDVPTAGGFYSIDISPSQGLPIVNFLVRNNSSLSTMYVDPSAGVENVKFVGNVGFRNPIHCYPGVVFSHNIWTNAKCGPTDRKAPLGFRSPARFDLHLKVGAAARGRGDPKSYPARDIDGQKRPLGKRVDAGADEVS